MAQGPAHQGATDHSAATDPVRATNPGPRRARSTPRSRTHCNSDRTGTRAVAPARSTDGRSPPGRAAPWPPHLDARLTRGRAPRSLSSRPTAIIGLARSTVVRVTCGAVVAHDQAQPAQRGVEILAELRAARRRGLRQRSNDQRGAGRESSEPLAGHMAQPSSDAVPDDRVADCLTDDKADPRCRTRVGLSRCPLHPRCQGMHHETGTSRAATFSRHRAKVRAAGQPGGRG